MNPTLAIAQLLNRLSGWIYAHSPTSNRYVLAVAVVVAALIAVRLLRRIAGWLLTAAVTVVAVMLAYRFLAG